MSISTIVGIVFGLLYLVMLVNRILYLRKIYLMDLLNLEQQGKSRVAAMQTKMIRDGTARYASQTADGIIQAVRDNVNEEIIRRKLKFKHDSINSIFTSITQFFGK